MISFDLQTNLVSFNSALARYMVATGKIPDEVLEKKGRDLGIRLFRNFRARKWGGSGKPKGLAFGELRARTAAGKGTKVRSALLAKYKDERAAFNTSLRSIGQHLRGARNGTADNIAAKMEERKHMRGLRSNLWRTIVGQEVGIRQRGIGVLAASFLWYRSRSSQARGKYFVKNKTGKPMGYVDRGEDYFQIIGETDGLAKIDARYGVVSNALSGATENMLTYCRRKERDIFAQVFGGAA